MSLSSAGRLSTVNWDFDPSQRIWFNHQKVARLITPLVDSIGLFSYAFLSKGRFSVASRRRVIDLIIHDIASNIVTDRVLDIK